MVVVAGNLFDLRTCCPDATDGRHRPADAVRRALDAHDGLRDAITRFVADDGRRMVVLPGRADAALTACRSSAGELARVGVEVLPQLELAMQTATGTKLVTVASSVDGPLIGPSLVDGTSPDGPPVSPGGAAAASERAAANLAVSNGTGPAGTGAGAARPGADHFDGVGADPVSPYPTAPDATAPDHTPASRRRTGAGADHHAPWSGLLCPDPDSPWQQGLDRLADRTAARRFLTSRLLYRRFARFAWWLLVPYAVVLLLRDPAVGSFVTHLVQSHPGPARAVLRARRAGWVDRLEAATVAAAAGLVVLAVVLGFLGRKAWGALGGGPLPAPWRRAAAPADADDAGRHIARDAARDAVAAGRAGLVTGAAPTAELTDLGDGFFACTGACGLVVDEHPGRLGLPPVFLARRQLAWVELETGALLHVRLSLTSADEPGATVLERLAARRQPGLDGPPRVVATYPHGLSWPPAPDLQAVHRRSRRVRRLAAAVLALAGAADLLSAVTPPLRGHLRAVLHVLPLGAAQTAGALVALAGVALLALARGVRRGQQRAWLVATAVLGVTVVLHAVHGGDLPALGIGLAALAVLLVHRREFQAVSDRPSLRSALTATVGGALLVTVAATVTVELPGRLDADGTRAVPLGRAVAAVVERLAGIQQIPLPTRIDGFLSPALLAIGITLAVLGVVLATRPVVVRAHGPAWAAERRARDIVRRHGRGTLDYFALRRDKQWFFHRDSLVAYGIFGGICLVSPDPIGPLSERAHTWAAFRAFADRHGWAVTVMGAGEDWLPVYRATGMRDVYIGDEAVVDVQRFSLAGGGMKGLRQAYNRVARYGYRARFLDPATVGPEEAARLAGLLDQSRRGERERGFSMMLGRLFDAHDEGLLMCVVDGPDGSPVAMCQFVPAPGIGGYSLDLMRRARGEHPNGLIDFALIATIEHLRAQGLRGLSLNFAAMRAVLDGERGDGVAVRMERWALERMSTVLQIESLWRFNAKYGPRWQPRYALYDAAEHLVPALVAIVRAESLWDVPVLGKLITAAERRRGATGGTGIVPAGGAGVVTPDGAGTGALDAPPVSRAPSPPTRRAAGS
jgi:lysylphosphatidylglycerol synthetase-like protein (DUF2156 family)